jgi:DNA polymerase (family X)
MSNQDIATLFKNIAAAYTIKDDKKYRFQIIAYQNAADTLEKTTTEIHDLYRNGQMSHLPGLGPSMRAYIEELLQTGKVSHFESILKDLPPAIFPLLDIPSFGPKKAYKLVTALQLSDPATVIDELEQQAQAGKIAGIEGFGEKSQADVIQAIKEYRLGKTKSVRMVLPFASELAEKVEIYLRACKAVLQVSPLGSLRRRVSTIGDIDFAISSKDPEAVIKHFLAYPYLERVIEQGEAEASIIVSGGKQVDLKIQPPERFGSLLQHFTGSKRHNIHLRELALRKGLSLSEYGIKEKDDPKNEFKAFDTEEKFYKALGLSWIPPEIREDAGEIELAQKGKLPDLIELQDIKGDFHIHSDYPIEPSHDMGKDSMETMIKRAIALGYDYIAFSEHNPSVSKHTKEHTYQILLQRNSFIEHLKSRYKNIRIISLLEIDILTDGSLAVDDKSLELLDGALVSIHSGFSMDEETMTKRVLKGLAHPKAKILSHPTGRLINQRTGYELNWEKVFAYCKEHNKALEINAWPLRLDLPDALVKEAISHGIKLSIDTDSHAVGHMDLMEFGVSVARRGWAKKSDILNAMGYNELVAWFKE